jgi:hypothetical protein
VVGALLVAAAAGCSAAPVAITPPAPAGAILQRCTQLGNALPVKLEGLSSRVTRPPSPLTHAWGKPPVVLRCGVPRPAGIAGAELTIVNGVRWFQQIGHKAVTWTALRPGADVAVTIPTSYQGQSAFLVDLAAPLKRALP